MALTILQMKYFCEVCRQQNITRAAQELHIAQPSLSLAMRTIEKQSGLNLFRHVGRSILITQDGQRLLARIQPLLKEISRFEDDLQDMAHRRNHIRIAIPAQIGTRLLPLLLGSFRAEHPEIILEIVEPTGIGSAEMVKNEELDFAVINHSQYALDGLRYQSLQKENCCFCTWPEHPLAGRSEVALADIAAEPLVLFDHHYYMTQILQHAFAEQNLKPNILHFTPHLWSIRNLVQSRVASTLLIRQSLVPGDSLQAIPITPPIHVRPSIVTRKDRQIYPNQKIVMDFIRTHLQTST